MARSKSVNSILQVQCQTKVIIPQSLKQHAESTARGLSRSCWAKIGKEYMGNMVCSKSVDENERGDNGCNPLTLKWVDKMNGGVCRSNLVRSGN